MAEERKRVQWSGWVKVQRPLNDGADQFLVYNEDRTICIQSPYTELVQEAFGDAKKLYIWAILRHDDQLILNFNKRYDITEW